MPGFYLEVLFWGEANGVLIPCMKQWHSRLRKGWGGGGGGGSEGMPPRKLLKIRCSEIESEGIFHNMVPIAN